MLEIFSLMDWIAFCWFVVCWSGYTFFAKKKSTKSPSVPTVLSQLRSTWMTQLLDRDMRISDATALGILQRNVAFFASTTIFILAGLLTVLGSTEKAIELANTLPFTVQNSRQLFDLKLLVLIWIFIYAFFKFSWSVRQYNFTVVCLGAAPKETEEESVKNQFGKYANDLMTSANNSFNFGLRAYHFSMSVLAWFIQPWLFILATTWIVGIIYRHEFRSRSLQALIKVSEFVPDSKVQQKETHK